MKKIFLLLAFSLCIVSTSHSQLIKFGVKAGANFANLESEINTDNITSYHLGAFLEAKILPGLGLQPELMYSSQGATIGKEDFKLDYISVPVVGKFYIIPGKVALEAGPQFSFLVNEDTPVFYKNKTFDFAVVGGASVNITNGIFAQARYVIGLTDATENADAKNRVFQLSVGYRFL
jgi:opacity protein-like surface antigen